MRLPYLQLFIDDSRRHGATLAALAQERLGANCGPLKADPRWWRGLLEDLWDYGVKVSGDDRPTGVVHGTAAVAMLAGCVGYPGPALELAILLEAAGVLERKPDRVRVKGVAELYGPAWDRQKRDVENGRKGAKKRWSDSPPIGPATTAPHSKTETETETETDLSAPSELPTRSRASLAKPAGVAQESSPTPPAPQSAPQATPRPPPRKLSAAEDFVAWMQSQRAAKTPLSDEPLGPRGINAAFGRALTAIGRPQLESRYLAFLDEPDGASKEPPWPWRSFLARYPHLKSRPTGPPKARPEGRTRL